MKAEEWARQAWDFYEGVTGAKGLAGYFERAQQEARAAALEEAAKVAERHSAYLNVNAHIAIAKGIRALLEGK